MKSNKKIYLDKLNEMFNGQTFSQEKILGLLDEILIFFQHIKGKLESTNPEEQQAALEETLEMKRVLESKLQSLVEQTGLTLSELSSFVETPSNLSEQERNTLEAVKTKLQDLQQIDQPSIKSSSHHPQQKVENYYVKL